MGRLTLGLVAGSIALPLAWLENQEMIECDPRQEGVRNSAFNCKDDKENFKNEELFKSGAVPRSQ